MKQNITHEQWNELSDELKDKYWKDFGKLYGGTQNLPSDVSTDLPDIGRMLEFLGDDLNTIEFCNPYWIVGNPVILGQNLCSMKNPVLVDGLWEAVKNKLNWKDDEDS